MDFMDDGFHSLLQLAFEMPLRIPFPKENLVIRTYKKGILAIPYRILSPSQQLLSPSNPITFTTLRVDKKPQSSFKPLVHCISFKEIGQKRGFLHNFLYGPGISLYIILA